MTNNFIKILRAPCGLPQGKRLVRIVPLYLLVVQDIVQILICAYAVTSFQHLVPDSFLRPQTLVCPGVWSAGSRGSVSAIDGVAAGAGWYVGVGAHPGSRSDTPNEPIWRADSAQWIEYIEWTITSGSAREDSGG